MHLKFIWVLWRSIEKLHRNRRFLQCNLRYASLYTFSTGTRFIKRNYLLLFTTSRVYLEPTQWPAPIWLVSSVGRALHLYYRGYGLKSRIGLNFFFHLFECYVILWWAGREGERHNWFGNSGIPSLPNSPATMTLTRNQIDPGLRFPKAGLRCNNWDEFMSAIIIIHFQD